MPTLTVKVPEQLRDQAQELAEKKGYQSTSEYIRTAMREKIESDLVVARKQDDTEMMTLEEARELVDNHESSDRSTSDKDGSEHSKQKAEA